uniref:Vitamin K-dependent gamma-carboxylase n=1 Tax=Culex pipiens TaxID=7175 RepID=A0A8D8HN44_CULPI
MAKAASKNGPGKSRWSEFRARLAGWFTAYCGHDLRCLQSLDSFTALMYRPTDGAALGVARALFGLMMLIDIPEERGGGNLDFRWGDPRACRFPLVNGMEPLGYARMGVVYLVMWLGALGITLGYRFRLTCLMFVTSYWYVFVLDKSSWNNHSYLYGLLGTLFLFTDANKFLSFDAYKNRTSSQEVPFWNNFILKYQFFILYFLAGLKKMCPEWLSGYAMTNLSYHWVFLPFRSLLGPQLTDLLIVHWFGCIFDTLVVFFSYLRTNSQNCHVVCLRIPSDELPTLSHRNVPVDLFDAASAVL